MCVILCFAAILAFTSYAQDKQIRRVPVEAIPMNSGEAMFKSYCTPCHGAGGKGDGPAALALKTAPADLTQLARKHGGKFPEAYVTAKLTNVDDAVHGSKEMPIWGPLLSSVSREQSEVTLRIKNIVDYIKRLQAK